MKNCALCLKKPADKTGSHIIPHFLLIRVDGLDNSKLRGKGVGAIINSSESRTYIEREISPEKWHEMLGDYNEEEIVKMGRNPSIVDNLICIECENRFRELENEYAPTLKKFKEDNIYKSDTSSGAALLFWISILWRMSVSHLYGFELTDEQNEFLRKVLDRYTKTIFKEIDFESLYQDNECIKFSYRLIRCPNYSEDNSTAIICHSTDSRPYSLMIDEYLIFFYFDKNDIDMIYQQCFGFFDIIKHAKPNFLEDGEYILPVRKVDVNASIKTIIHEIKDSRLNVYNKLLDRIHNEYIGTGEMPIHIKHEIMDEITSDQKALGRKYTMEDVISSIAKILYKY